MKNNKSIQISIPNPCTQSWDEMTPSGNGKFCDHCAKTVIDFTEWSDGALYSFFSKNSEHVCGRFVGSQINRPINIPVQPHSKLYRIAVAFGLTIVIVNSQQAQARKLPPLVEQSFYRFSDDTTKSKGVDTTASISGTVLDDKKFPLINASVTVYRDSVLVNGTVTDFDGNYVIKPMELGVYTVKIITMGYDTVVLEKISVLNKITRLDYIMKKSNHIVLGGGTVYHFTTPLLNRDEPTKRTYTREELEHRR